MRGDRPRSKAFAGAVVARRHIVSLLMYGSISFGVETYSVDHTA
jgi:hypothetical protein